MGLIPAREWLLMILVLLFISFQCDAGRKHRQTHTRRQHRLRRLPTCSKNEFTCGNNKCIPLSAVCNGINECADGRDESTDQCTIVKLGACTLPQRPKNLCDSVGGSEEQNSTAHQFLCPSKILHEHSSLSLTCTNGVWTPPATSCTRMCKNISLRVSNLECYRDGREQDCKKPLLVGTKIIPYCQRDYKPNHEEVTCDENGEWDHSTVECIPKCGSTEKYKDNITTTTRPAHFREFPWIVAVYNIENQDHPEMMPGVIISPFLILTRNAPCASLQQIHQSEAGMYRVLVGKRTTNMDVEDDDLQKSYKVKTIHSLTAEEGEIAIFELAEKITMSPSAQPVCLNWEKDGLLNPKDGTPGQVPHWISTTDFSYWTEIKYEVLHTVTMFLRIRENFERRIIVDVNDPIRKDDFWVTPMTEAPISCGYGFIYQDAVSKLNYLHGISSNTRSTKNQSPPKITKMFRNITTNMDWISAIRKKSDEYLHQDVVLNIHPNKHVTEICKSNNDQVAQNGSNESGNERDFLANGCELPIKDRLSVLYDVHCLPFETRSHCENAKQGSLVPEFTSLTINCTGRYESNSSSKETVCFRNKWMPPIEPCRKRCDKIQIPNVDVKCFWQGMSTNCDDQLKSGATAIVKCASNYHSIETLPILVCNEDGHWNGLAEVSCILDSEEEDDDEFESLNSSLLQ
jgi:hypothetical protein